jgi:hypothetical protein
MATAVSIEAKITLALEQAVLSVAQAESVAIAAPGVPFTPTGDPYLRVTLAKNTPINVSLSGGREPVRQGILLVVVGWPVGPGILPATELAAKVRDAFKFNTRFNFDGGMVKICDEPTIQGDVGDGVNIEIPVVIRWMAFT